MPERRSCSFCGQYEGHWDGCPNTGCEPCSKCMRTFPRFIVDDQMKQWADNFFERMPPPMKSLAIRLLNPVLIEHEPTT